MLKLEKIDKWYGDYHALKGVNADIKKGEVVVICGPSGSGKSTLIRTITRLEAIQSGRILFEEKISTDLMPMSTNYGPGSVSFFRASTCSRTCLYAKT